MTGFGTFFDDVKNKFWQSINAGEVLDCPCCRRSARIWKRKLHSTATRSLILLYKLGGDREYIHASKLVLPGQASVSDISLAKHWGLISLQQTDGKKLKKTSGFWRLTQEGIDWVKNLKKIKKYVLIYDDECLGFVGEEDFSVIDALEESFNYYELMSERGIVGAAA